MFAMPMCSTLTIQVRFKSCGMAKPSLKLRYEFADCLIILVSETDVEIGQMDIETLLHVENDLRQQNEAADKHVASLHGHLDQLHFQEKKLEGNFKKVDNARNWETKQKDARAKKLARAKADLESKRIQAKLLSTQAERLKENLVELERKVKSLHSEEQVLKGRLSHPSFEQVLMNEAERMGSVSQQLASKAIDNIIPELQLGWEEAEVLQKNMENLSGPSSVLVVLVFYGIGISVLLLSFRCLQTVHHRITLPRVLFTTDVAFVALWLFILLSAMVVEGGPIRLVASHHVGISIFVLAGLMMTMIGNVFLRCVLICVDLKAWSFAELFCAIFVTQHFYQAIWTPFLLDQNTAPNMSTYFLYVLIHSTLAVQRARSIHRMPSVDKKSHAVQQDKVQGHSDWLKKRMTEVYQQVEDFFTSGWNCDRSESGSFYDGGYSDDEFSFRRKWEKRTGNVKSWKHRAY